MTVSIDSSGYRPRYANRALECGRAQIRAQCRHLATVVTVSGTIDAANIEKVSEYSRRIILAEMPFILDLSGVRSFDSKALSVLYAVDDACSTTGVEWALIPGDAVKRVLPEGVDGEPLFPTAASVPEALHYFADLISTRRQMMLPLLHKSA